MDDIIKQYEVAISLCQDMAENSKREAKRWFILFLVVLVVFIDYVTYREVLPYFQTTPINTTNHQESHDNSTISKGDENNNSRINCGGD